MIAIRLIKFLDFIEKAAIVIAFTSIFFLGYNWINDNSTSMHEQAHQQIATYFGCLNGKIVLNSPTMNRSYFICNQYESGRDEETVNKEYELHSWNEIVYYNIQFISESIFFGFFVICMALIIVSKPREEFL